MNIYLKDAYTFLPNNHSNSVYIYSIIHDYIWLYSFNSSTQSFIPLYRYYIHLTMKTVHHQSPIYLIYIQQMCYIAATNYNITLFHLNPINQSLFYPMYFKPYPAILNFIFVSQSKSLIIVKEIKKSIIPIHFTTIFHTLWVKFIAIN